jgi:hypothetical protein
MDRWQCGGHHSDGRTQRHGVQCGQLRPHKRIRISSQSRSIYQGQVVCPWGTRTSTYVCFYRCIRPTQFLTRTKDPAVHPSFDIDIHPSHGAAGEGVESQVKEHQHTIDLVPHYPNLVICKGNLHLEDYPLTGIRSGSISSLRSVSALFQGGDHDRTCAGTI